MRGEKDQRVPASLPLPKWCLFLLGVPTFYMPLAFLLVVAVQASAVLAAGSEGPPEWADRTKEWGWPAIYVMGGLWPIYIAWVGLSSRLDWREKAIWLGIVLFLNLVGMPMFYIFMLRRYLGLEGRPSKRDEAALDRFLSRHSVSRDSLSAAQLAVLLDYCRNCRLSMWASLPNLVLAILSVYMALVVIPRPPRASFKT